MSKLALRVGGLVVVIALLGVVSYAVAGSGTKNFTGAPLNGYEENPDISTLGTGSFTARLADDGKSFQWELSYSGIEGGNVLQSHIHFGKPAVNGGISIFLCTNLGNGPAGTQPCPQSGTIRGEADASDVIGPGVQGIAAGEFDEILAAMRAGHAYANVHSQTYPNGEIRAQIDDNRGRGRDG
jgi:hypothetical protein